MRTVALAAAVFMVAFAQVEARAERLVVIPVDGELTGELAQANEALTRELAAAAEAAGATVEVAQASRADIAILAECDGETAKCLEKIANALGVDGVVLATVTMTDEGVSVRVVSYRKGNEPVVLESQLSATNTDDLIVEFRPKAASVFKKETTTDGTTKPPVVEPPTVDVVVPDPVPSKDSGGFSFSRVPKSAWIISGTGLAMTVLGGGFMLMADRRQGQIDDTPANTIDDFERLRDLESEGRTFARLGNGLVIGGLVATAVGVTFAITLQQSPERPPAVALTPVVGTDQVGFALTILGDL